MLHMNVCVLVWYETSNAYVVLPGQHVTWYVRLFFMYALHNRKKPDESQGDSRRLLSKQLLS